MVNLAQIGLRRRPITIYSGLRTQCITISNVNLNFSVKAYPMTLFKASLLTATAAVTLAAAATSVQATVYYWSYTLTNGQGAGSGAFTVNGALPSAITA